MKVKKNLTIVLLVLLMTIICTLANTYAATYPEKTIQIIVAKPPGGGADLSTRMIAAALEKQLGSSVVVLNREGGQGVIGTNEVANAKPDGYTLSCIAYNEIAYMIVNGENVEFTQDSFDYIFSINIRGHVLATKKDSQFDSLDKLLEYAKDHPKEITIGIPGEGCGDIPRMLMDAAGVELTIVNCQTGAPLYANLLGGHIEVGTIGTQFYERLIDENCHVLAQTVEREYGVTNVPTFSELGVDGVWWNTKQVLMAPAGTPQEVIDILVDAMDKSFEDGSMVEMLENAGEIPMYQKGEELEISMAKYFNEKIPQLMEIKESKE